MRNGLTITIIFEANTSNYGVNYSNITTMKTLTRGDFKQYPYISRQALRYSIVEQLGWNNTPVNASGNDTKKVVQFSVDTTIVDYPEIDLFGYMKTAKKSDGGTTLTRNAVVRLSHAIGLEPYKGDMDYLTNMGLAKRNNNKFDNSIVSSELQRSFYSYTITIDLDLVGIDKNGDKEVSNEEKSKRVNALLSTVEFLYRDIKGRRENLSPIFVIGGVYERKNPFFMNSLSLNKNGLNINAFLDLLKIEDIKKYTNVGLLNGVFINEAEIKEKIETISINEFFENLKKEVKDYYENN